jgi:hypothetical protein
MLRNRMLVLVGGCLLTASASLADGVAYVDCASHPEDTQVFGKPRRTPDVVESLPCGERFTILQNGFIFSRIQTKDGKVGYVYSNLISADHSGASVAQPTSTRPAVTSSVPANVPAVTPIPATTSTVAQPNPTAPAQPQAMPAEPAPTQAAAATSNPPSAAAAGATVAQPDTATSPTVSPTTSAQSQSTSAQAAPSQVPAASTRAPETSATVAQSSPTTPAQTQEVPDHLAITETAAPTARVEAPATAAQPDATPAAQPEAAPAEPAAPAVRPARATESWERPNAGVRTVGLRRLPLIELFGGYGFARFDNGGGTANNLNGVIGSFGWNVMPWLQVVADSSYSVVTGTGIKDVLYGNHYGPRVFLRRRSRWGATPFVEGLVGGSRADTTVSGTGGYSTSTNSISFKVGGGLDIKPSRHFEIRLFDADYYRTSFGPNVHQNNYWVSTGIVLRLFGGSE